ncbi:MAG: efflux transporter outer membrane subunit [Agriterribacter sp.]
MLRKIININSFPVFLSIFLFTACKVGKEYQRPVVEVPAQFSNNATPDTSSIANLSWKQLFADTTLQNLINAGIQHNYDLLQALKRIDIAEQQVKRARLLQLPEANLQISGAINRPSDNSLNGLSANSFLGKSYIENYNATVNISWEADIWGKIRRQKEVTLASYLQTFEAAKAVQTQLVTSIAQGYFNLQMLDKQLEITKKNLALTDSFVAVTNLLQRSGEVTALAVQQAQLQQQATAYLIPGIEQDITLQENALQVLTGRLPGTLQRQALSDDLLQDSLQTGLPLSIVNRRPDVRADEMALVAANARVGIAQASMYPALNITAGAGLESFKSANWISIPNSLFVLAAGSITQPLFQRRELKTNFETARIQREEAVLKFKQSVLNAVAEVENALTKIDKSAEQKLIVTGQSVIAQQAVHNAQLLFKSDMANYLEVITAQQRALQSELQVATIERIQRDVRVELYRSLGGGWQ